MAVCFSDKSRAIVIASIGPLPPVASFIAALRNIRSSAAQRQGKPAQHDHRIDVLGYAKRTFMLMVSNNRGADNNAVCPHLGNRGFGADCGMEAFVSRDNKADFRFSRWSFRDAFQRFLREGPDPNDRDDAPSQTVGPVA